MKKKAWVRSDKEMLRQLPFRPVAMLSCLKETKQHLFWSVDLMPRQIIYTVLIKVFMKEAGTPHRGGFLWEKT